jgi:hypothetical protein
MPIKYFKPYHTFDHLSHKYDIGILVGLKKVYEDNLFTRELLTMQNGNIQTD